MVVTVTFIVADHVRTLSCCSVQNSTNKLITIISKTFTSDCFDFMEAIYINTFFFEVDVHIFHV